MATMLAPMAAALNDPMNSSHYVGLAVDQGNAHTPLRQVNIHIFQSNDKISCSYSSLLSEYFPLLLGTAAIEIIREFTETLSN